MFTVGEEHAVPSQPPMTLRVSCRGQAGLVGSGGGRQRAWDKFSRFPSKDTFTVPSGSLTRASGAGDNGLVETALSEGECSLTGLQAKLSLAREAHGPRNARSDERHNKWDAAVCSG